MTVVTPLTFYNALEAPLLDRYAVARTVSVEEYQRVIKEDETLLDQFGLGLISADSTLRVVVKKKIRSKHINPWDVINLSPQIWEWLRPMMVELVERRAAAIATGSASEEHVVDEDGNCARCFSLLGETRAPSSPRSQAGRRPPERTASRSV